MVAIVQIIQLLALNYQYYIVYLCLKKIANSVFSQSHEQSDCEISRNIAKTMSHYNQKEHRVIFKFYDTLTINDVINDTLQEDTTYDTL